MWSSLENNITNETDVSFDNKEAIEINKYEKIESKLKEGLGKIDFNLDLFDLNKDYTNDVIVDLETVNVIHLLRMNNIDINKININLFVNKILKLYKRAEKSDIWYYEKIMDSWVNKKEIKDIYSEITSYVLWLEKKNEKSLLVKEDTIASVSEFKKEVNKEYLYRRK
jgi:hypothetical protein